MLRNQIIVLLVLMLPISLWAKNIDFEIDHADPDVRSAFLKKAFHYQSKKISLKAKRYYHYAIQNWHSPEQAGDLLQACRNLLLLLYQKKKHIKEKQLLVGCPDEQMELWYGGQDRDSFALMKIAPVFPRLAIMDGRDGWVLLKFDVNTKGKVENIQVVDRSEAVFVKPAKRAAKRFLYLPATKDGKAVIDKGVMNKITFQVQGAVPTFNWPDGVRKNCIEGYVKFKVLVKNRYASQVKIIEPSPQGLYDDSLIENINTVAAHFKKFYKPQFLIKDEGKWLMREEYFDPCRKRKP